MPAFVYLQNMAFLCVLAYPSLMSECKASLKSLKLDMHAFALVQRGGREAG